MIIAKGAEENYTASKETKFENNENPINEKTENKNIESKEEQLLHLKDLKITSDNNHIIDKDQNTENNKINEPNSILNQNKDDKCK